MYAEVNQMFGDIVKVTPSSKAVGDMALFMISNTLTPADVLEGKRDLAFPESVVDLISGRMGQPPGGFPVSGAKTDFARAKAAARAARRQPAGGRLRSSRSRVGGKLGRKPHSRDVVSYLMFPKVVNEFIAHDKKFSDTSMLPTPLFFYGQLPGQEVAVDIETGKTLIIKFLAVGDPHPDGRRTVFFELNGQPRNVNVKDLPWNRPRKPEPKPTRTFPTRLVLRCPEWSPTSRPAWAIPSTPARSY